MGKNERVNLPDDPEVPTLVIPVGVCLATTVAPETFTLPLNPAVVSTSENKSAEEKTTIKNDERTKNFLKFIILFQLLTKN